MLTDEQKQQLGAEEAYRNDVRMMLAKQNCNRSRTERFFGALNTPFMLWLMSTIVVGVFGWAFSTYQAHVNEEVSKRETIRKIDTEITNRLATAQTTLRLAERRIRNKDA